MKAKRNILLACLVLGIGSFALAGQGLWICPGPNGTSVNC